MTNKIIPQTKSSKKTKKIPPILDKELLYWTKNFIEKYKKVLLSLAKK